MSHEHARPHCPRRQLQNVESRTQHPDPARQLLDTFSSLLACVLTPPCQWLATGLRDGHLALAEDGESLLTFVVLAVATAKALFVMMYFMHLKFEGKWKYVLLAPTIVLAMAIPAALMPDIGSHYYDYDVPQTRAPIMSRKRPGTEPNRLPGTPPLPNSTDVLDRRDLRPGAVAPVRQPAGARQR